MRYRKLFFPIYRDDEIEISLGLPNCLVLDVNLFDNSLYLAGIYTSTNTDKNFWEIAIFSKKKKKNSEGEIVLPTIQVNSRKRGTFGDCTPDDALIFRICISEESFFYEVKNETGYHYFSAKLDECARPIVTRKELVMPSEIYDMIEPIIRDIAWK